MTSLTKYERLIYKVLSQMRTSPLIKSTVYVKGVKTGADLNNNVFLSHIALLFIIMRHVCKYSFSTDIQHRTSFKSVNES